MKKNDCDVFAINETGLNGSAYVEVCDRYKCIAINREWVKGNNVGVDFIIKHDLEWKRISCDSEYYLFCKDWKT